MDYGKLEISLLEETLAAVVVTGRVKSDYFSEGDRDGKIEGASLGYLIG